MPNLQFFSIANISKLLDAVQLKELERFMENKSNEMLKKKFGTNCERKENFFCDVVGNNTLDGMVNVGGGGGDAR